MFLAIEHQATYKAKTGGLIKVGCLCRGGRVLVVRTHDVSIALSTPPFRLMYFKYLHTGVMFVVELRLMSPRTSRS